MEVLVPHPRASIIKVRTLCSINFKTCIALVSANPATVTLNMPTVASLKKVETGPGHVIQLPEGKDL